MASLKGLILTAYGYIGEPELRYLANGTAVLDFPLAVPRQDKEKTTLWLHCRAFGQKAESLAKLLSKGDMVLVQGYEITLTAYTRKDGQASARLTLLVEEADRLRRKSDQGGNRQSEEEGTQVAMELF